MANTPYTVPPHYAARVRHMQKPMERRMAAQLLTSLRKSDIGLITVNDTKEFSNKNSSC